MSVRDQQQQAGNRSTADSEAVNAALKDVHTFLPGIIHSFDPDTQSAQVQPAIRRIFTEKGPVNLPLCVDVPVHFMKTGPFCITGPVTPGDECLLGFFERAIDRWYVAGGVQEPSEYRLHDLSDGFCIPGISSIPSAITGFNSTDLEIRSLDGGTKIQIKPDGTITQENLGGSTVLSPAGLFTINAPAGLVVNSTVGTTLNGPIDSSSGGTFVDTLSAGGMASGGDITCTNLTATNDITSATGNIIATLGNVFAALIGLKTHKHVETGGTTNAPIP